MKRLKNFKVFSLTYSKIFVLINLLVLPNYFTSSNGYRSVVISKADYGKWWLYRRTIRGIINGCSESLLIRRRHKIWFGRHQERRHAIGLYPTGMFLLWNCSNATFEKLQRLLMWNCFSSLHYEYAHHSIFVS